MKLLITNQLKYNLWANTQLVNYFLEYPHFLDTEIMSSFKTIRLTLAHIFDAQEIWWHRIRQEEIKGVPSKLKQFELVDLIDSSKKLLDFTQNQEAMALNKLVHFKNLQNQIFEQSVKNILLHVVNHSTYHRGQVSLMLKQLQADNIPATDLIHFFISEDVENL